MSAAAHLAIISIIGPSGAACYADDTCGCEQTYFPVPVAGASGARAVLAGLGGGFGAGRVYERYNVALQELQTGGSGIIPSGNVSFDDFKNKVGGVVNQVRNAVGLGTAAADSAKEEDDSKPADSDEERS